MKLRILLVLILTGCARINYGVPDDDGGADHDNERTFVFTGGSMPAGVDFTRASAATYIDANGVLQTVASNVPRFVPSGAGQALLVEGEHTNMLHNSRFESGLDRWELDNIPPTGVNVVAGGLLGDGGHHLELRREGGEQSQGILQLVSGQFSEEPYTLSFVARRVGDCAIDIAVDGAFLGEPIALTATAQRYTFTFSRAATDDVYIGFFCSDAPVGAGFDLTHVQLEGGPIATSIIVNDSVSGPARRAPDRLVATVAQSPTPTVSFRGQVVAIADRSCLACLSTLGGEPSLVLDAEPSDPEIGFVTYSARTTDARIDLDHELGQHVAALASSSGLDLVLASNGVAFTEDTLGAPQPFDHLVVGALNTDLPFDGVVRVESVSYSERATNAEAGSTLTGP